jgi:hypothetical protein
MAERVEYGKPRRLNSVSVTMILIALAGGYWMWRFFPAYFDGWTVDHILKESASEVYRANRLNEPERTTELTSIVNKAKQHIREQTSITDPDLTVTMNILENDASMSAEYLMVITHPVTSKTTTLHFSKREHANIKKVDWDK